MEGCYRTLRESRRGGRVQASLLADQCWCGYKYPAPSLLAGWISRRPLHRAKDWVMCLALGRAVYRNRAPYPAVIGRQAHIVVMFVDESPICVHNIAGGHHPTRCVNRREFDSPRGVSGSSKTAGLTQRGKRSMTKTKVLSTMCGFTLVLKSSRPKPRAVVNVNTSSLPQERCEEYA